MRFVKHSNFQYKLVWRFQHKMSNGQTIKRHLSQAKIKLIHMYMQGFLFEIIFIF
jgi:hypothetical protein